MQSLGEHWEILLIIAVVCLGFFVRMWIKDVKSELLSLQSVITKNFDRLDTKIISIRDMVISLAQRVSHIEGRMGVGPTVYHPPPYLNADSEEPEKP